MTAKLVLCLLIVQFLFLENTLCYEPCSYTFCPEIKPDMINVHLVPHSHDDVGWLKTVDEVLYFLGSNKGGDNPKMGVSNILDSMVRALARNSERKFIQVEGAFFWRWWEQQDDTIRSHFSDLVKNGQITFIGGGWSMNDEAATHYISIIDNMSLGFRILNETFGECAAPKIGWQIDPFGHSKEQANLFKQMGFDGLFFGRLDFRDKAKRKLEKSLEMLWNTNDKLDHLFTGVNFDLYGPPPYFCWDYWCGSEPMMDDPDLKDYNVEERVDEFLKFVDSQASFYASNNILITMGFDFHYEAAHVWYMNLDKLIKHVNNLQSFGYKYNLVYSTPACYLKALNEADMVWPKKQDDFFPYASTNHSYWTGYFTSRPTSKRMMIETNQILQTARHFWTALYKSNDGLNASALKEAVDCLDKVSGLVQHHDAITGTEKQKVANDYHERMASAQATFASEAFKNTSFQPCPMVNISQCSVSESNDLFSVNVYNPLAQTRSYYIRLPVSGDSFHAKTFVDNVTLESQMMPVSDEVKRIPGRVSSATHEIWIKVPSIPPLESKIVIVEKDPEIRGHEVQSKSCGSSKVGDFSVDIKWYSAYEKDEPSGAYTFRPVENTPNSFGNANSSTLAGDLFEEIRVRYTDHDYVSFVQRQYFEDSTNFDMEIEWLIGPVPIGDVGKEIILEVSDTGISNLELFYTDANGRQMIQRRRDYRETFEIDDLEPVASNYYPVSTHIMIEDTRLGKVLTVSNDRPQGASSITDGQVEFLIHRRHAVVGGGGVGEALNETEYGEGLVVRGRHFITIDSDRSEANRKSRTLAKDQFFAPYITLSPGIVTEEEFWKISSLNPGLGMELPDNLNLITLQPWLSLDIPGKFYLVRLEHLFQVGEHPVLSNPEVIDMGQLLSKLGAVVSIRETTLGANIYKENLKEMMWNERNQLSIWQQILRAFWPDESSAKTAELGEFEVVLEPMDIRTFIVEII